MHASKSPREQRVFDRLFFVLPRLTAVEILDARLKEVCVVDAPDAGAVLVAQGHRDEEAT